jgi:hypothetical protein
MPVFGPLLASLALALCAAGPDASVLVARLAAPRFAEREAAMKALEELGAEALPALWEARDSRDPEVRARVSRLLKRLDLHAAFGPTLLALDFENEPLLRVAPELGGRAGARFLIERGVNPALAQRPVTLRALQPVEFWKALDRLCEAGRLHLDYASRQLPNEPDLFLLAPGLEAAGQEAWDHGPFRVVWLDLKRQGRFAGADLLLLAEWRVRFSAGEVTLQEAVDDRGQSLLSNASVGRVMPTHCGFGYEPVGAVPACLFLELPAQPGRSIQQLRGTIDVAAASRRNSPSVVWALNVAEGQRVESGAVGIMVKSAKISAGRRARLIVELTFPASGVGSLDVDPSQWEFADAAGRALRRTDFSVSREGPKGVITLDFSSPGGVGPPAQVRYYDLVKTRLEVPFTFHDLPIP